MREGTNEGVAEYEMSASLGAVQSWQRTYPLDQPQEMYGYLTSYPAVAAGEQSPCSISITTSSKRIPPACSQPACSGKHLHIQGTLHADGRGVPLLTIDSWEATS